MNYRKEIEQIKNKINKIELEKKILLNGFSFKYA